MYHLFTPVCKSLKLKVWKIKPDKLYIKSRGPHTAVYTLSEVPLRLSRQARANSPGKGMRDDFWNHTDVFIFCRFNEAERQVRILFIQRGQETNEPDRDIYSYFFIAVVICQLGTISQFKLQLHHFISVDTSTLKNHFSKNSLKAVRQPPCSVFTDRCCVCLKKAFSLSLSDRFLWTN